MEFTFDGELWFWRGPAPWHFLTVPTDAAASIREHAPAVTYGWGMIPARAYIGRTSWTTSLFPKDETYLLPVKVAVRRAEQLEIGDLVAAVLTIGE